jgi:hypothetical protein
LAYLQSRFTEEEIHQLFDDLRIDLSPPGRVQPTERAKVRQ